jgi:phosphate acetyltransferase
MAEGIIRKIWDRAKKAPRKVVLPEGKDPRTAQAARLLIDEKIGTEVTVLGSREEVEQAFAEAGVSNDGIVGLDPVFAEDRTRYAEYLFERRKHKGLTQEKALEALGDVLYFGAAMVALGDADTDVAGACHTTGDVIRAALHMVGTAEGIRTVSGSFLMEIPDFLGTGKAHCVLYGDCAVVPNPTAEQLGDIAIASAHTYETLMGEEARVAMLSFSTKGSAEHPDIDKVRTATARAREVLGDRVDGEMQADAALIASIGERKSPGSPVAGQANVLIFPDLDAGNIGYKLTQRLAKAEAIGPVVQGLAMPIFDLSRGCDALDIVTVAAIGVLQAAR